MSDTGQDSSQERRHCRLHRQAAAAGDGKRVEQFDDHLVVVTAGRSEQETHDAATEADHTVQLVTKVLHGLAAKVTAHSVGMMVNLLLGRPALKLADLAV